MSAASALMPTLFSLALTRIETSLVAQELKAHYTARRSACATLLPANLFLNTALARRESRGSAAKYQRIVCVSETTELI